MKPDDNLERELAEARERNQRRLATPKPTPKRRPRWYDEKSEAQLKREANRTDKRPARLPAAAKAVALNQERHRLHTGSPKDLKKYGLTRETWEKLVNEQDSKCAICGRHEYHASALAIDHCHATGRVRGLLCRSCNLGLGNMRDDPERLANAMRYLARKASS